jgi:fatty acid desaturase
MLRFERWGRAATLLGYACAWVPNPVSMALIALGASARWAVIAHHVTHKGLDRVPGTPARLTSAGFAQGARRYLDWMDWILPEAWNHEHNVLHHAYTNEVADPDLVEENVSSMRSSRTMKILFLILSAFTWKATYYAPNTIQVLQRKRRRVAQGGKDVRSDARGPETTLDAFDPRTPDGRELWVRCLLPYLGLRFVLLPLLFAPLGAFAVLSVFINSVGAELLTNLHSYCIITPNHAGDDLYRFDGPPSQPREWFLRQVLSSVNCNTGGDLNDFLHGFLNYQIEHHLYPDLPPLQLQRLQPRVRAVCEAYGVPYRQEPVFARVRQMASIFIGDRAMRHAPPLATLTSSAANTATPPAEAQGERDDGLPIPQEA